jgi:hypothetical protein
MEKLTKTGVIHESPLFGFWVFYTFSKKNLISYFPHSVLFINYFQF